MPDFLIKDIPEVVIDRLAFQAVLRGMTLEMFIHQILRDAGEKEPTAPLDTIRSIPERPSSED